MRSRLEEHLRNLCTKSKVSRASRDNEIPREDHEVSHGITNIEFYEFKVGLYFLMFLYLQENSRSGGKNKASSSTASKLRQHIKNLGRSKLDLHSFNSHSSWDQPPLRATSVPAQLNFVGRSDAPQRTSEEWHGTSGKYVHL